MPMSDDEFFYDWSKHEDELFTNRGNFFLVAESMLFAATATLLSVGLLVAHFTLCSIGIFVTVIWFLVNYLQKHGTVKIIREMLIKVEPRWVTVSEHRKRLVDPHDLMGIILPVGILIAWLVLLLVAR